MATVSKCMTLDCDYNEEGKCQLEEITLDEYYECDQANQTDDDKTAA